VFLFASGMKEVFCRKLVAGKSENLASEKPKDRCEWGKTCCEIGILIARIIIQLSRRKVNIIHLNRVMQDKLWELD
jgi:hypothetical protein